MLGQLEQSDVRTARLVSELFESQIDDDAVSRLSTCGTDVGESAELQVHLDTGSVQSSLGNVSRLSSYLKLIAFESCVIVIDFTRSAGTSFVESAREAQAVATLRVRVAVESPRDGLCTRIGRIVRPVNRLIQTTRLFNKQ